LNTIVLEKTEMGDIPIDIYSKLANDRILFIYDYVDDQLATDITATMFLKDQEDQEKKISLFINSEGGDIRSVFMIYDMIKLLSCDVETVCVGSAMNEVVLLLAAGTPGLRYATKNAAICPSELVQEQYHQTNLDDAKEVLKRLQRDNKNMMTELAACVGKKMPEVSMDFERKVFMSAKQAKSYGIIDAIMGE
jgi:ATP-dependent Clp protease, protease subunit